MKGVVKIAVAALTLTSSLTAFGATGKTEICIRLIGAHSGKPFIGRDVQIFGTNVLSGPLNAKDILFHFQTKTGPKGIAHFTIAAPLPRWIVFYSAQANGCLTSDSFVTKEVVQSGVVAANTCAGKHQKYDWREVTAKPGEIVIFAVEPRGPW